MDTPAEVIAAIKAKHRISERKIALLIGVSNGIVSHWNHGEHEPSISNYRKLANLAKAGKRAVQKQLEDMA